MLLSEETSTVCSDIQTSKAFLEIQNLPGSVRGKVSTITSVQKAFTSRHLRRCRVVARQFPLDTQANLACERA